MVRQYAVSREAWAHAEAPLSSTSDSRATSHSPSDTPSQAPVNTRIGAYTGFSGSGQLSAKSRRVAFPWVYAYLSSLQRSTHISRCQPGCSIAERA